MSSVHALIRRLQYELDRGIQLAADLPLLARVDFLKGIRPLVERTTKHASAIDWRHVSQAQAFRAYMQGGELCWVACRLAELAPPEHSDPIVFAVFQLGEGIQNAAMRAHAERFGALKVVAERTRDELGTLIPSCRSGACWGRS